MERKILFRGKRVDNGEWVEGSLITIGTEQYIVDKSYFCLDGHHIMCDSDIPVFTIPETIGQFTGLTDRNGVKIFEGDIVMLPDEENPCLIEWDDDAARFIMDGCDVCADFDNYYGHELEVIGNIYDNPEYIK